MFFCKKSDSKKMSHILVLGEQNSGKKSLINSLKGAPFREEQPYNKDSIRYEEQIIQCDGDISEELVRYHFTQNSADLVPSMGQRRLYLAIIVTVDLSSDLEKQLINTYLKLCELHYPGTLIIAVGTKCDARLAGTEAGLEAFFAGRASAVVETSAKQGVGIKELGAHIKEALFASAESMKRFTK